MAFEYSMYNAYRCAMPVIFHTLHSKDSDLIFWCFRLDENVWHDDVVLEPRLLASAQHHLGHLHGGEDNEQLHGRARKESSAKFSQSRRRLLLLEIAYYFESACNPTRALSYYHTLS